MYKTYDIVKIEIFFFFFDKTSYSTKNAFTTKFLNFSGIRTRTSRSKMFQMFPCKIVTRKRDIKFGNRGDWGKGSCPESCHNPVYFKDQWQFKIVNAPALERPFTETARVILLHAARLFR